MGNQHDRDEPRDPPGHVDRDERAKPDADHTCEDRDQQLWGDPYRRAEADQQQLALLPALAKRACLLDPRLELGSLLCADRAQPIFPDS